MENCSAIWLHLPKRGLFRAAFQFLDFSQFLVHFIDDIAGVIEKFCAAKVVQLLYRCCGLLCNLHQQNRYSPTAIIFIICLVFFFSSLFVFLSFIVLVVLRMEDQRKRMMYAFDNRKKKAVIEQASAMDI